MKQHPFGVMQNETYRIISTHDTPESAQSEVDERNRRAGHRRVYSVQETGTCIGDPELPHGSTASRARLGMCVHQ